MLRQRRNYVQPRVRRRYGSGATPGHPQRRRELTVHNWALRIMAGLRPSPVMRQADGPRPSRPDPQETFVISVALRQVSKLTGRSFANFGL